jgi:hypothetical protein
MNRIWLAIGILGMTCAGCRSGSAPESTLLPRSQVVSNVAPVPKNLAAPVGKWTKSFDDDSHLDLEIEPTYIRFALQSKEAVGYWAFVGTCRPNAIGVLSGVITTIQWEGEEDKVMRFGGEFRYTLWYAEDGERLRVMKIQGDCFDSGGEANCTGPYEKLSWRVNGAKSERVEAPGVRPAHFEPWTIGDEGVRMTFGKAAEREQFPGSKFAPLGPGSFGRD